jgi:hypothetical protein
MAAAAPAAVRRQLCVLRMLTMPCLPRELMLLLRA